MATARRMGGGLEDRARDIPGSEYGKKKGLVEGSIASKESSGRLHPGAKRTTSSLPPPKTALMPNAMASPRGLTVAADAGPAAEKTMIRTKAAPPSLPLQPGRPSCVLSRADHLLHPPHLAGVQSDLYAVRDAWETG